MRDLLLLGYSGSIGTQALDVLSDCSEYRLKGLACRRSLQALNSVRQRFPEVEGLAVADSQAAIEESIRRRFRVYQGPQAAVDLIRAYPQAVVLNAIVGTDGLAATLAALEDDRTVLLANKESLVIGGHLVRQAMKRHPQARLIPIDSEHSAIDKLKRGRDKIEEIWITCSGGALRDRPLESLSQVKAAEVLAHPNWQMGPRITVDCATMVNKAFEVIEAHYLFNLPLERIKVVLHDESAIHSLVRLADNSLLAEIGPSDMRIPIAYALNNRRRRAGRFQPLQLPDLHFRPFEPARYPLFDFILANFGPGSSNMAVINRADEVAVERFLRGEIGYNDIVTVVEATFKRTRSVDIQDLGDVAAISAIAAREAETVVAEIKGE